MHCSADQSDTIKRVAELSDRQASWCEERIQLSYTVRTPRNTRTHRDVSGPPLGPLFRRRPLVGDPLLDDGQLLPREGPERGQAALGVILGTGHGGGAQNGGG